MILCHSCDSRFQHAAARRRLIGQIFRHYNPPVSTRSRPKAAVRYWAALLDIETVSTRSRPKAAADVVPYRDKLNAVSTRSRPKAAGK